MLGIELPARKSEPAGMPAIHETIKLYFRSSVSTTFKTFNGKSLHLFSPHFLENFSSFGVADGS